MFLNLIIHIYKPVVITGVMRLAMTTSVDGLMNLYQAISLASSDEARGMALWLYFLVQFMLVEIFKSSITLKWMLLAKRILDV